MGMYTEIFFRAELHRETPQEVIDILAHMVGDRVQEDPDLPDHEFFECPRWDLVGLCGSAYFPATFPSFFEDGETGKYPGPIVLGINSSLKNYNSEIEKFFDWIDPYVNADKGSFLGYLQYEESDQPTFMYKQNERPPYFSKVINWDDYR